MLVVDVTKGMQTQTAECLVIGQITSDRMLIVMNKTDMLPAEKRVAMIEKMTKRLRQTLQGTKFHDARYFFNLLRFIIDYTILLYIYA